MRQPRDLLQGTLETLVLKALSWGPRHGYAIGRWIEQTTEATLAIEEGSLYPALYRLERRALIESEWGVSDLDRPAKFYRLTQAGRARLKEEVAAWNRFTWAVGRVLEARG
jgi:transcriptional regulator